MEYLETEKEGVGRGFLSLRAVLLGAVMCLVISISEPYWTYYLHTSTLFLDYSVGGAMFFLLLMVLILNSVLRLIRRRLAIAPQELVVVTAMMLVAGGITTMGLTGYLIPNVTSPYYLADEKNQWKEKLWPHLPKWAAPLDADGGTETIQRFYGGLRDQPKIWAGSWRPRSLARTAGNFARVTKAMPWGPWVKPLALWAVFVMALYACMTSLMAIMRKQWVDHERLSFPIAQVPQELCAVAADPWGSSSIFRRKLFWLGIAVPFVVGSLKAAHTYYPQVPVVPVYTPIRGLGPMPLQLRLSFAVLGFTFLVPNHVAFSLWSLNLLSFAFRSTLKEYGLEMQENLGLYGAVASPIMAHQGMGAMLVFALLSLYFSRHHFRKVLLCAFGRGQEGYDENEPSSYLLSLILLCVSLLVMVIWLWLAGLPLFHSAFLVAAGIMIFYGLTRVVAQCGVSVITPPMIAPVFLTSTLGGAGITSGGIGALTQSWSWSSDIRTSVMSSAAHGMYLTRRQGRGLLGALMLAAIITFVTSTAATIWLGYRYGAANLDRWFFIAGPPYTFNWGLREVTTSQPPNFAGYAWTAVGAAIMAGLTVAHRCLFWWPFHPVGFIICSVDWVDRLWATIFLAWMIKAIVTKTAGNRGLRMARPFFVGSILGHFTVSGIWVIIDTIKQTPDNSIFWI